MGCERLQHYCECVKFPVIRPVLTLTQARLRVSTIIFQHCAIFRVYSACTNATRPSRSGDRPDVDHPMLEWTWSDIGTENRHFSLTCIKSKEYRKGSKATVLHIPLPSNCPPQRSEPVPFPRGASLLARMPKKGWSSLLQNKRSSSDEVYKYRNVRYFFMASTSIIKLSTNA